MSTPPRPRPRAPRRWWLVPGLAVWLVLVLGAFVRLEAYKTKAGPAEAAPAVWPAAAMARRPGRVTLVMLAHPQCPCTRASLSELRVVMSRFAGRIDAAVLFWEADGTPAGWLETDTVADARSIAGVTVRTDRNGAVAARFGARTSGHVVAYDGGGRLVFAGGITAVRGHAGDNLGRRQLEAALAGGTPTAKMAAAVYGCALGSGTEALR